MRQPIWSPKTVFMSTRLSWFLLGLQLTALLVGTQMPGAWRSGVMEALHAPSLLSSFAHLVLFAGMAAVAAAQPLQWSWLRVGSIALALAVFTEVMQFLALERHPQLRDVGIDMAGALLGVGLMKGLALCFTRR